MRGTEKRMNEGLLDRRCFFLSWLIDGFILFLIAWSLSAVKALLWESH